MMNGLRTLIGALAISALITGLGCSQSDRTESKESGASMLTRQSEASGSASVRSSAMDDASGNREEDARLDRTRAKKGEGKDEESGDKARAQGKNKLEMTFLKPFDLAKERLLEYDVNLSYKSEEFQGARKKLINITAENGFLKQGSAHAGDRRSYLTSTIYVRVDKLYDVLQALDGVGTLKSESIRVTDHTENMFIQQLKADRETLRAARKAGLTQKSINSRNWVERMRAEEQSEDALDAARIEKWRMRDKTSWAKVTVSVEGPELPPAISVPPYERAFIGLVNLLLQLSYVLLWLSPLLLLLALLYRWRKVIRGIFGRSAETPA